MNRIRLSVKQDRSARFVRVDFNPRMEPVAKKFMEFAQTLGLITNYTKITWPPMGYEAEIHPDLKFGDAACELARALSTVLWQEGYTYGEEGLQFNLEANFERLRKRKRR